MEPLPKKTVRTIDPNRIEAIDWRSAEIMAKLPESRKIQLMCTMGDDLRKMIRAQLQQMHPEWTETHMRSEMLRRAGHGKSV